MKTINGQRKTTTVQINKTVLDICREENIIIKHIIRSTFQFIYSIQLMDNTSNINAIIEDLIAYYEQRKSVPLSSCKKKIKTHLTTQQTKTYRKIDHKNRCIFFNKLMYLAIYYQDISSPKIIKKNPCINPVTVEFFTTLSLNIKTKVVILKSLINKMDFSIKNGYVVQSYYGNMYREYFRNDKFIKDYQIFNFIFQELQKIYFAIIILYEIKNYARSDDNLYKKTIEQYSPILKNKYNNNLLEFILNEVKYSKDQNCIQDHEFFEFLCQMHDTKEEKNVMLNAITKYYYGKYTKT